MQRAQALHRHLAENASECVRRNITVRVDTINADHSVAYCTVEQRNTGPFRRTYTVQELIHRADQALAPLIGLGIVPLLTVRHESLKNRSIVPTARGWRAVMDQIPELWRWLGSPLAREGFTTLPVAHDPFGWRQAMSVAGGK